VFDTATVTGRPAAFLPTGAVTYQFFTNGSGSGTPASTQTVPLNADGTVPNSAVHGPLQAGAYSFIAVYGGDSNYTGSTSPVEPLTIGTGISNTATNILDATTRQAPSGVLGESVFDTATVTGSPAAFTPTGTVTYEFFTNGTGNGTPAATQTVPLNADGTVPDSAMHGPLAAGAYSFIAVYSGDHNYQGSTSGVEPLIVNRGSTGTATAILDGATNQPPSGVTGESVFDTATVTGSPAAFTRTGTVTYKFFTNGTGSGTPASTQTVPLNADGTVPDSVVHGPLAAGAYSFIAVYSGDSNYNGSTSTVEPLTINQGGSTTATAILNSTGGTPTGTPGESVFDTATVTGSPAAFTPTGTVTYQFFTNGSGSGTPAATQTVPLNADGTVPDSAVHGPLAAGAYSFIAVYSGDHNYTGSISAVEPLTVNKATPTITTTPKPTEAHLGVRLQDVANLAGAYNPTGSITFKLYAPGVDPTVGPAAYTEIVTGVNGNGTYHTTVGFVATNVTGIWHWVATYNSDANNKSASTGPLDEPVTIPPQADLTLSKTVSQSQVYFGQNVTYTFTVRNLGPDSATGVVVKDPFPSGLVFVSAAMPSQGTYDPARHIWSVGTLADEASATLRVTCRVVAIGPIVNTARASSVQFDPALANNVASATVVGLNPAAIISKRLFLASSQ